MPTIAIDVNCKYMCKRMYRKAEIRGIDEAEFNMHIQKMFQVENVSAMDLDQYHKTLTFLNALPITTIDATGKARKG